MKSSIEGKNAIVNPFQDKVMGKILKTIIFLMAFFIAGFMLFAPLHYRFKYHPEISPSDFLPIELGIILLCGTGVLIGISLFLGGIFTIITKLFRKTPLSRSDLGFFLNTIFTVLILTAVYKSTQIYFYHHPGMSEGTWVAIEFFACCAVITLMPIIGMIPIGMAFNFFWGRSSTFGPEIPNDEVNKKVKN